MATDKQVSKLAHLFAIANLAPYTEQIINGKAIKTTQPFADKLKTLSVEQASTLIGLFKSWERSWEDTDLGLVKQMIKELKLL